MQNQSPAESTRRGPDRSLHPASPASTSAPLVDIGTIFGQALAHHRAGRLPEAAQLYQSVLQAEPRHFDSLHMLGVLNFQRGAYADAVHWIDAALVVRPDCAPAHNHRGAALNALKRRDEALASYGQAIALAPDDADAFYNRGNVLREQGRYEEAIADYDRAIAIRPDYALAFNNRGSALRGLKRCEEAISNYDRAIALKPDYAEAFYNRGNACNELRRFEEAIASCSRAIALKPNLAEAFNNRGNAFKSLWRFEEALKDYEHAISLKPDYAEAHCNRGDVLRELRRLEESRDSFGQALALNPELDFVRGACLFAKMQLVEWSRFDEECAGLLKAVAQGVRACSPFVLLATDAPAQDQLVCARLYARDFAAQAPRWRGERYRHQRIRVAYLSSDFCDDHPVALLTAGLFEQHDRSQFETVAISLRPAAPSPLQDRLRACFDQFIDVGGRSDQDVANVLRELEIDIAVDLNGFTSGSRPHIFAQRGAPVQVNYLGFAGTLGQRYWDYIVADRFAIPPDRRDCYAENVVYLPDTFMVTGARRIVSDRVPSRAEAGLPEHGFVFCCFNNTFKLTPALFDVWMMLLREVAGSVLWLSTAPASAMDNLRREAERRGIAADRLIFAPKLPRHEDHLMRLGLADLFLDTLNYNAHVTACDALRAGVPVLTCAGATFASRVAGSLLTAIGLPELITASLAQYTALALQLACDPDRLAAIKQKLARNQATHPLFDTPRFTRHLETAYRIMWERAERGEQPASFAVAPIKSS